ncbi:hypothetical protein N9B72_02260 [Bacteriovoracaceae bacterium]|nr:hypothetical protein [Bacteriovoracaceae bacterium]
MKKLLLALLLLSSCGLVQNLFVRKLDYFIASKVSKRLHLYNKQEKLLDVDIDNLLNNQASNANDLIKILDDISIETSLTQKSKEVLRYYYIMATDISTLIAKYLAELDRDQTKEFLSKMNEQNRKIEDELSDFNLEKTHDALLFFVGPLTPPQKNILKQNKSIFKQKLSLRYVKRIAMYKKMVEIFLNKDKKQAQFIKLFSAINDPKQAMVPTKNRSQIYEVIEKLRLTLNAKQIKFFKNKKLEVQELLKFFIEHKYD